MLRDDVVKELRSVGVYFVIVLMILQVIYFKSSIVTTLRVALSFFWLFVVPGLCVLFYWRKQLVFVERALISIPIGVAILGVTSYFLGLGGLHVKYHGYLVPGVVVVVTVAYYGWFSGRKRRLEEADSVLVTQKEL